MANQYSAPRGTLDYLPPESVKLLAVQNLFQDICDIFRYEPIRTPTFESTELFARGAGESSDIVSKEMYTFPDKKGRSLTLRPEGTPGVVRALIQNGCNLKEQIKVYYICPMFRYQRPQKGRYREHTQAGIEFFGSDSVTADVEVITLGYQFLSALGLKNLRVAVNSLGAAQDRDEYNKILNEFIVKHHDDFCPDCHFRVEHNPMRVFDCKVKTCLDTLDNAPNIADTLSDESSDRFLRLQELLGLQEIEVTIDPKLVRGLDYYTHTVFEIMMGADTGQQSSLMGGGRYDGLVKLYGGPDTPAIGFGAGLERISEAVDWDEFADLLKPECEVAVICMGDEALAQGSILANMLRNSGIITHIDHRGTSLKKQLGQANTLNAIISVIIGDEELSEGIARVKLMETGDEDPVRLEEVLDHIIGILQDSDIDFE